MENMDTELTVPKWVLIVRPKIPQMPQKISAQKFEIFKKSCLGVSVVRVVEYRQRLLWYRLLQSTLEEILHFWSLNFQGFYTVHPNEIVPRGGPLPSIDYILHFDTWMSVIVHR